ncbi:N-acetyltransferase [Streptomyces sp. NPDC048275]|uniref:GNAT family N-acetyltransferase n=1 Tax=Streptomyces sp. NPDC048275 TaxID=3155629 RepID=UPI0033C47B0C
MDHKHRCEILVDGTLAGFTEYRDRDEQRVFCHTEIDDAFAGQGLASVLVQQALPRGPALAEGDTALTGLRRFSGASAGWVRPARRRPGAAQ